MGDGCKSKSAEIPTAALVTGEKRTSSKREGIIGIALHDVPSQHSQNDYTLC